MEQATLETGDLCVAALTMGVIIERKTPPDLAGCLGRERERFERELRRSRYAARFIVICEGTLADVIRAARGIHRNAVIGTLAAWSTRYCPFLFAGDAATAAALAFRALASQVRDAARTINAAAPSAVSTLVRNKNVVAGRLGGKDAICPTP